MEVNLQPLLDAIAPYVGIPIPGQRPLVVERLRLERAIKGATVERAELVKLIPCGLVEDWCPNRGGKRFVTVQGKDAVLGIRILYTHSAGAGKAVLYDRWEHHSVTIRDTNEKWAHRLYHKLKGNCSDRYCKLNKQTTTIASTARERAQLRYTAKLEDGESVEW